MIRQLAHHAAKGIDLSYQMAFRDSANRRITGHLRDQVDIHRHDSGLQPQPGTGSRRLAAGVACANHDNIKM